MTRKTDFLDEIIRERRAKNRAFQALVDAALDRRRMLRQLAEDRVRLGLSQTAVAAQMGTSQSAVARIESGKADIKLSTIQRYAATLGRKVEWRVAPATTLKSSARGNVRTDAARAASLPTRRALRH